MTGSVAGVVVWNWSVQSAVQTILLIKERIMGEIMNRTMDEITDTNESMDDLLPFEIHAFAEEVLTL